MSAAPRIRETRGADGWREIAINGEDGELLAVVTRPLTGAPWFLHRGGREWKGWSQCGHFTTRKAAIAAATTSKES